MNVDAFDQQDLSNNRKDRRSLSFSHSRFHRRNSSSEEDDESPVRKFCFQNEYDDDFSRDSLSEFDRIKLNDQDGRGHRFDLGDDLSAITRKRTFSSSDPTSTEDSSQNGKQASEKRAATKICRVCGDKAYSYNFSVVTCESCKAFFRRNANKDKDIRCPFNDNCDINIVSRRFCQKCRLAKCFKVGMKKEWIMSEEARREKKQRIQDNRERRMAERAQEEKIIQHQQLANPIDPPPTQVISNTLHMTPPTDPTIVQPQIGSTIGQSQSMAPLQPLNSSILPSLPLQQAAPSISTIVPSAVVPSIVSMPPVQSLVPQASIVSQTEPTNVMQQVIQQAQQVQNAQLLAQVAMQSQSDQIASMQQVALGTTTVPSIATTNVVPSVANLNHLAQVVAMQNQADPIASIQQAAIASIGTTSVQSPTTNASIVSLSNLAQAAAQIQQKVQLEQMQQNLNANIAAQRIQASQNLAEQQQLASAVAVAAAISNQSPIVPPSTDAIAPSIAPILPSIIPPTLPSAAPLVEQPVIHSVLPPNNSNNEMIAVRKDVLMNIVQENIENRHNALQQQLNTPPAKCKCVCQCGRYSSDSVIVDRVMADMLQEAKHSITPPAVVPNQIESMDCSRHDIDCCMLSDDDKMALNELEQADKAFWATEPSTADMNASDAALRKMIRMFTSLNSFNKFSRADQSNLLRHGCPAHLVIRQIMMGNINENQQNLMVVQFYTSLRAEIRSNRQLMLLLSVMVIFDPDTPNIEHRPQIVETCNRLKSILKRMLYTIYLDAQKTISEYDDLINKLNVLQTLNNNPTMQQTQNGLIDSHRMWSAEILEPLLSRELFEPNMMITSNVVNTISSMT